MNHVPAEIFVEERKKNVGVMTSFNLQEMYRRNHILGEKEMYAYII